jgi:hypothetical protein
MTTSLKPSWTSWGRSSCFFWMARSRAMQVNWAQSLHSILRHLKQSWRRSSISWTNRT